MVPRPSSPAENAEGERGCAASTAGGVRASRARIGTLGRTPLAGGQEPARRQATLMQRGPIVAGRARGCSCAGRCPAVPAGRGGGSPGRAGALGLQPGGLQGCLLCVCSDSRGRHAFHGSTQSPPLSACACGRGWAPGGGGAARAAHAQPCLPSPAA